MTDKPVRSSEFEVRRENQKPSATENTEKGSDFALRTPHSALNAGCVLCGRYFKNERGVSVHVSKVHNAPGKKDAGRAHDYARLGREVAKDLPANHRYEDIAAALGITNQGAQQLTMTALGKFIYRLDRMIGG